MAKKKNFSDDYRRLSAQLQNSRDFTNFVFEEKDHE